MLSVSSIGSASGAADYYGKDDYYVTGEADSPGLEWGGKASATVGLTGKAEPQDFKAVLEGKHPLFNDPDRRESQADSKHRAGWDLTFSAPKSVSLAILLGKDERLDRAHDQAVNKAMAYAEKHFAITRVRDQGKIKEVRTGNLLYAQTVHGTSRAGDPQRHTHVIVANATVEPSSGKVRALETLQLFKHRQLVGRIYQAELAKEAIRLGYDVQRDPKVGTFELASYNRNQLEHFSKRNTQIRAAIEIETKRNGGPLTAAQRDALVLKDRPKKLDTPRHELVEKWGREAASVGLDPAALAKSAQDRPAPARDVTPVVSGTVNENLSRLKSLWQRVTGQAQPSDPYGPRGQGRDPDPDARAAVSFGLQVAEQGRAVFTRHDVVFTALMHSKAGMTSGRLEQVLGRLEGEGRVQQADVRMHAGITTDRALKLEASILSALSAGRNAAAPIMSEDSARLALDAAAKREGGIVLNEGQGSSAHKLLTSRDRIVGVQGSAGVGKTTMFRVVRELASDVGREIIGVAPTHDAVRELENGAGIKSQTIESFLQRVELVMARDQTGKAGDAMANLQHQYSGKSLLVDEASMLSNASADRLLKVASALQLERVILIGDERQLGSPEAGAPFRLLLEEKMDHSRMTEIRRQKDPEIRAAVAAMAQGTPVPGLRALGSRIIELGRDANDTTLAEAGFAAWKDVRDSGGAAPIIVPTHALREKVADLVRTDMAQRGELAGAAVTTSTLSHIRMTTPESFKAASFTEGQVLVFHSGIKAAGIQKGDQVTITGRDERNDALQAQLGDRTVTIDLRALEVARKSKFQAYREKETAIQAGDRLVWERRDPDRSFVETGNRFTVTAITKDAWTIKTADGVERTLPSSDPALRFVGYDYAMTADRSQGSTHQNVVAVLSSKHGEGANQARAYVQASRAAETLTFITNDTRLLGIRLNSQSGQNAIACKELASLAADLGKPPAGLGEGLVQDKTGDQLVKDGADLTAPEKSGAPGPEKEPEKDKALDKSVELAQPGMSL